MSGTTRAARAKQQAKVRRLAEQRVSNREIARRVGISEPTVRRWRRNDAASDAAATQNDAAPDAPVTHPAAPAPASPSASDQALTVALDDELRYHLGVLADAGHDAQTAIARAVAFLSDGYAYAWDFGVTERGTVPDLRIQVRGDPWPDDPWPPAKPAAPANHRPAG